MLVLKLAIRLGAFSAIALCLTVTPASSQMSSPSSQGRARGQIVSGQVASGIPASSRAFKRLTAEWEQWLESIPASVNPATDTTGENCMVGQRGPTWFLAGVFNGGSAERTCSIPEDVSLFFPVVNAVNINSPNVCGQGPDSISVAELRALSAASVDGAVDLSVKLDGKPISKLVRTKSVVFAVALPESNLFDAPCEGAGLGNVPAGVYSPSVNDGIYVKLAPLKIGKHTLRIQAVRAIVQDVTYHLTVVPVQLH
jgi:hypothetical protein